MSSVCRAVWNQKCQTHVEKLLQTKKDYRSRLLFLNLQSAIEKVAYPQTEKPFWSIKIGHFGYNADPMDSIKEKSLSHCKTYVFISPMTLFIYYRTYKYEGFNFDATWAIGFAKFVT